MQDIPRFISSSRAVTALGLCWLVAMAGCSSQSSRLDELRSTLDFSSSEPVSPKAKDQTATIVPTPKPIVAVQLAAEVEPPKPVLRKTVIADAEAAVQSAKVMPVADAPKPMTSVDVEQSSWCTSLRETAMASGNILRSPIASGSYDNTGRAEVSLGLSYSNFHKADLLRDRAEAECRKYMAQTGLQRLVFAGPQNLTMAGFKAKADAIDNESFELARLRKQVTIHMEKGDINREKATALFMLIDQLHADGQSARSQAARRMGAFKGSAKPAQMLGTDLLRAEHELDQIDSQIRSTENYDVSAEALYSKYLDGVPMGANPNTQGFGGKVSFSMKLGVVDPRRFEHERLASEAKQRAIRDEPGGPIWQAEQLRLSHQRAIAGLLESRREIEKAIAEAKHLLATMADVSQPEFTGAKLNARYQLLKLRADQAAVTGSLDDIKRNLKQLSSG